MLKSEPNSKDKNEKNITKEYTPQKVACIGTSLFLKGELSGDENLIIEGQFQGTIDLRNSNLFIGPEGKVEADIHARNITINGNVKGNIFASGKVFIAEKAQMDGNISTSVISIMDGALFKGSVKMEKDDKIISPPKEKAEGIIVIEEKTADDEPSE